MICSKILVAFDDSELAAKALQKAVDIARTNPEIEVDVLYSITFPIHPNMYGNAYTELEDSLKEYGETIVKKAENLLTDLPNKCSVHLLEGAPTQTILEHVTNNGCDLIIMGSRGLSGLKEFLGSVSHYIVQKSPVPVFLVK
ncbi:universal stress protein [Bacillus massiliglaciei]|uniref:universal stress protein n=1 Tax=Bacillus massiliglaciei TaxID=1816693 RepID=UPI0018FEC6A6|nr:universal stress protein [Bacillus massiliglaciei]